MPVFLSAPAGTPGPYRARAALCRAGGRPPQECVTVLSPRSSKIPVNLSFLLPRHRRTARPVRKPHWIEKGTIVFCCVLLTSCSFTFWNTKDKFEAKKSSQPQKNLVKPSIAEDSKIGPSVRIRHNGEGETDEDRNRNNSESEKKPRKPPPTREEGSGQEKDESSEVSGDRSDGADGPFKKHDHFKYKRTIKNTAIDTLNKHRGATAARLCRDRTTDLWTLSIYKHGNGRLSFVIYFWDEVDGKWERSFDSGNVPAKKWRSRLRYSSADKTCEILKGARLFGSEPRR